MQRLSLNICVSLLAFATLQTVAMAEVNTAEQAMIYLSKSASADSKCNFLSTAEHDTLVGLLARAELSFAASNSAEGAKLALSKGRQLGTAANCDASMRSETLEILNAAQTAAAQAPAPTMEPAKKPTMKPAMVAATEPQPSTVKLEPTTAPKPKLKMAMAEPKVLPKKMQSPAPAKLQGYANLTQRYYLARRCGSMNGQAINALYQNVVAAHQQSLKAFGRKAVALAMQKSEAQAQSKSCS